MSVRRGVFVVRGSLSRMVSITRPPVRWTSGRYASYSNVFLLYFKIHLIQLQNVRRISVVSEYTIY